MEEQKTPFKELNFSQKLQYIWDYYKIPIIIVIVVIAVIVSFVREKAAQKNTVLSVLCVNSITTDDSSDTSSLFDDFLTDNGYDTSSDEISVNHNVYVNTANNGVDYQNMAVLTAYFGAHEYNVCFMDDTTFDHYAQEETFCDLRDYLDDDTLARYQDNLVYTTAENGDKYPSGIRLTSADNQFLSGSGLYDSCTFGICYGGSDTKLIQKLSGYILK